MVTEEGESERVSINHKYQNKNEANMQRTPIIKTVKYLHKCGYEIGVMKNVEDEADHQMHQNT